MGMLRGPADRTGDVVNGVELGHPIRVSSSGVLLTREDSLTGAWFAWDGPGLPSGTIDASGVVTIDEE